MDGNGLPGRMFTNMGGEMLGLEMSLHPPQTTTQNPPQNPQNHHQKCPQLVSFTHQQHHDQPTQLSTRQTNHPYITQTQNPIQKNKSQMTQLGNSDEDEPECTNYESNLDGKRKNTSLWHRMKWTDNMVKLLIVAVYYMGDEAGSDFGSDKKKLGMAQKKGKWKSVSKAMMEKGFFVSPQQCEDKFNDLNKRYKRVTDILGKGTACKVVENQSLLETMDLSSKLKDEVRKLLNSKHLFFREMCAYHNSCGHGTVGPTTESANTTSGEGSHLPQEQLCLHSHSSEMQPPSMAASGSKLENLEDEEDDEDEDEDDEDNDHDDEGESEDEDDEEDEGKERKRARTTDGISSNSSWALQKLKGQLMEIFQDASKGWWEKKQWVMTQLVQLEEEGLKFKCEGLELEKQRLKWIKFSSKKERETEKMKIHIEKNRLENEKMVLVLKKKEIELLFLEQRSSNPSCDFS